MDKWVAQESVARQEASEIYLRVGKTLVQVGKIVVWTLAASPAG
jgi:gamma-glutamylcysteine synthetase